MSRLKKARSPVNLLVGTLILTMALIGWLSWNVYAAYTAAQLTITQDVRLSQLRGTILQLDEVLTMSARLAATTGDVAWVRRYESFVPQLDAAIQEAIRLAPLAVGAQIRSETDAANIKLVELETTALAAVQQSRPDEARRILFSTEYEANKQVYANGMAELFTFLQRRAEDQQQQSQQRLTLVLVSMGILLPILLVTWVGVLKYLQTSVSLRETLIVTQTRETTLEQTQIAQEAIIAERTAALQQALATAEERETQVREALTAMQTSETALRELSAPIIPILTGVLVAPIIGTLDIARAAVLSERVLQSVEQWHASTVIFDITGVPIVDTHVAHVLLHTAAAVRLLGALTMLVGVRPEVAQTIVALGIDLVSLRSFPTLQQAVESLRANGTADRSVTT